MKEAIFKIVKHSSIYGLGNFATKAIAFFLLPLYTTYLSPADYGVLQICNVINAMLTIILLLGMNSAMFRVYFNTEDKEEKKTVFTSAFTIYLLFSILVVIPLLLLSPFLSNSLLGKDGSSYLITIVVLSAFFEGIYNLQLAYLRAEEKPLLFILSSIIKILFYVTMNIIFVAHLQRNYVGVREVNLLSIILIVLISLPVIIKGINFRISLLYIKDILKIGIPLGIGAMAIWILTLTDRFMLKLLLPESIAMTQVGIYSLGAKFSMIIKMMLVSPFMMSWGTLMFAYQKDTKAKELYASVLNYFTFVAGIIFLILTVFSKEIIMIIARNSGYYGAYTVVPILSFSVILHGLYTVFSVGVILTNKTIYVVISNYSAAFLNIILNFLLIPKHGIMGAAIASLIAYLLNTILLYNFAQKLYFIRYKITKVIIHFSIILLVVGICCLYDFTIPVKLICVLLMMSIMPLTGLVNYKLVKKILFLTINKIGLK